VESYLDTNNLELLVVIVLLSKVQGTVLVVEVCIKLKPIVQDMRDEQNVAVHQLQTALQRHHQTSDEHHQFLDNFHDLCPQSPQYHLLGLFTTNLIASRRS
jgi:hypothetical protein